MSTEKETLGNPMAIMAATEMLSNPKVIKGVGTGLMIGGLGLGAWLAARWIKKKRQQALLNRAGTDPEIRAVVNIFSAIPAGLKKGQGSLWNTFGLIKDMGNKIATIWQSTDTENILAVAKDIHANNLDLKKIYSKFNTIYEQALYPLLQEAMDIKDLNKFTNLSSSGTVSDTQKLMKSQYALVKVNSGVTIREKPDVPNWASQQIGTNKYGVVPFNYVAGIATGVETYNKEDDTVFVELLIYDKEYKIHKAYAWKGAFSFHDQNMGKPMYYFEKGEFNGL